LDSENASYLQKTIGGNTRVIRIVDQKVRCPNVSVEPATEPAACLAAKIIVDFATALAQPDSASIVMDMEDDAKNVRKHKKCLEDIFIGNQKSVPKAVSTSGLRVPNAKAIHSAYINSAMEAAEPRFVIVMSVRMGPLN